MNCGKVFFAVIISLTFIQSLKAEEVGCAFGELARNQATKEPSKYLEFKNDSYSVLPKDNMDWDDLRCYGFFTGVSMHEWRFALTADSLIHRTDNEADGKRIDELYFTIDRSLFRFSTGHLTGELTLGMGIIKLGNFEGSWMQKTTHEIYGTFRHMPMKYESIDNPLAFSGYASGTLKSAPFGIPVELDGSIEGANNGFLRAQTLVALDLLPSDPHWSLYAGNIFSKNYASFGSVYSTTIESESGNYIGTTFRAGNLQTGFAYNIQTGRPAGYAALKFPKPETGHGEKIETSMEFLCYPLMAGIRIRQTWRKSQFTASPTLGAESGPEGFDLGGGRHYRYSLIYLGMEAAYSFFDVIDLYALAAIGARIDQQRTCNFAVSTIIKEESSQDFFGESGIRVFIPSSLIDNPEWGISVSGGMEYYATIRTGFFPYMRLALVSSSSRPSASR